MNTVYKAELLQKRRWRIRKKVVGTALRPRLSVKFTGQNIYAQAIDDDLGVTLAFVGTLDPELRKQNVRANIAGAKALAALFLL
jgi:large subunit ribosomal protein L18